MIVEQRTYTAHIGKTAEYLKLYEAEGFPIQSRILGRLIGYFTTEIGELNQIIHMWGYDSFEERTRRRAELFANSDWLAYLAKARPLLVRQETKIMIPTSFSPIR